MSDLIDRQKAIDAVFELSEKVADEMLFIDAIVDEIENIPSAEPERTAKVETYTDDQQETWSICECGTDVWKSYNYCPECGARLEWK